MVDQLTRDSIAAQKAGMTYGKWKALHYVPPVEVEIPKQEVEGPEVKEEDPERLCRTCGRPVRGHANRRYCNDACKYEVAKIRQNEWQKAKYRREHEAQKRVCKHCGKEFTATNGNTLYCGRACKYEVDKARQNAKYWREKERMMANGKV